MQLNLGKLESHSKLQVEIEFHAVCNCTSLDGLSPRQRRSCLLAKCFLPNNDMLRRIIMVFSAHKCII